MNSPYEGKFYISQGYTPGVHDGLDLVGQDSKFIHATIDGTIHHAGWENPNDHSQGFGLYVCILGIDEHYYYFGHLSELKVSQGQNVKCTDIIGVEGSTGYSTGSHCHYEIRDAFYKGAYVYNVCEVSGIPNNVGGIYDDGYRTPTPAHQFNINDINDVKVIQEKLNQRGYNCGDVDGIIGPKTTAAMALAIYDLF